MLWVYLLLIAVSILADLVGLFLFRNERASRSEEDPGGRCQFDYSSQLRTDRDYTRDTRLHFRNGLRHCCGRVAGDTFLRTHFWPSILPTSIGTAPGLKESFNLLLETQYIVEVRHGMARGNDSSEAGMRGVVQVSAALLQYGKSGAQSSRADFTTLFFARRKELLQGSESVQPGYMVGRSICSFPGA